MNEADIKIEAIKAQIAELNAQLEELTAVSAFTSYSEVKDIGLTPETVAKVVANWEAYKQGKLAEPAPEPAPAEPVAVSEPAP